MIDYHYKPAKKRSQFRVLIGWLFYNMLRTSLWLLKGRCFVKRDKSIPQNDPLFTHSQFTHKTPLHRDLQDTEMWMNDNKVHNLTLAVKQLDGIVLDPGKVFSYWKLMGPPLGYRGYKKGMALVNGTVQSRIGGGLCQLSNLIYWMTLHTPLTVIERFRHSYDVFPDRGRTQPFGSGATCVYKYRDLQIRNDHVEPLKLSLRLTDDHLEGEWLTPMDSKLSYRVYEKKHWITQGLGGIYIRNNIINREVFFDGELVDDHQVAENHALMMYSPLLNEPACFAEEERP